MELTQYLQYAVALFFVLALIGILAWTAKRMRRGGSAVAGGSGGRHLGVVEAAAVDGQRRLVLVRRDHVGHLVLIGGGQDLLIETDIPLGVAREAQRPHQPAPAPTPPHPEQPMAPVARPPAPVRQPAAPQPATQPFAAQPQSQPQPAPAPAPTPAPAPSAPVAPAAPSPAAPAQQQPNLMQVRPGEVIRPLEDK